MTGTTVRTSTIVRDPLDRGLVKVQRAVIWQSNCNERKCSVFVVRESTESFLDIREYCIALVDF